MADYVLRGTKSLLNYRRTLNVPITSERMAAAVGEDVLPFSGTGIAGPWTSRRYTQAQAEALAALLGVTVANVTTNGGQEIVG